MHASKDMKDVYESIALATKGHYLVGLESERFLEEFLPWNKSTPDPYKGKVPTKQRLKNLRSVVPKRGQKESIVSGLETETQEWVAELSPKSKRLKGMMCKVLLSCIADAVGAAQEAYKAGILHCDLSAGNIMIVKDKESKEWRGVLIDWDMCLLWKDRSRTGRTGTWPFISAKILQNQGPITHTLWDDMESALWVLIYEALIYLKHSTHPLLLSQQMQRLFSDYVILQSGLAVGGRQKVLVLCMCSTNDSECGLAPFEKPSVNKILNKLGKVFFCRYRDNSEDRETSFNLDDPDHKWFPNCLREAAMEMEPLRITPKGLKSPTNDSNPSDDRGMWEPASTEDSERDYYLMPLSGDAGNSNSVQMLQANKITSRFHGLDGSLFGSKMLQANEITSEFIHGLQGSLPSRKRCHISEPGDEEEEGPVSKKQRK